jgi:hypothetical protein
MAGQSGEGARYPDRVGHHERLDCNGTLPLYENGCRTQPLTTMQLHRQQPRLRVKQRPLRVEAPTGAG